MVIKNLPSYHQWLIYSLSYCIPYSSLVNIRSTFGTSESQNLLVLKGFRIVCFYRLCMILYIIDESTLLAFSEAW